MESDDDMDLECNEQEKEEEEEEEEEEDVIPLEERVRGKSKLKKKKKKNEEESEETESEREDDQDVDHKIKAKRVLCYIFIVIAINTKCDFVKHSKINKYIQVSIEDSMNDESKEFDDNVVKKKRIHKKLKFELKSVKSSCRYTKGKTVLIHTKKQEIKGWIADISDKKILIRYKKSGAKPKIIEKWFQKNNKNIRLFTRD